MLTMIDLSSSRAICLIYLATWSMLSTMDDSEGDPRERKKLEFAGRPSQLGAVLSDLRRAKNMTLREVAQATGSAVSNAYLSQLEHGKIKKPSPNVLHSLSGVYGVPYETLMEKAGYLLPSSGSPGRRKRLAAFAIDDLTAEEEEELLKYLAFLRSRTPP